MKQSAFIQQLSVYFNDYLPSVRHCSKNTISSYADAFAILFRFFYEVNGKKHYQIDYSDITTQMIDEYVLWMQNTLRYSPSTQKQRISALSGFLKYASRREMKALHSFNAISGAVTPKIPRNIPPYFSIEEMKILLHLPGCSDIDGIRDAAILCLMYDSGARAQELCDMVIGDLSLDNTCTVKLRGKGNKMREVPISEDTAKIVRKYLLVNRKTTHENYSDPLFSSQRSSKMTTASIRYLVQKYTAKAKQEAPSLFLCNKYSPHSFRHSKAIHMLKAGVPLIYIRNFLGHESVQTTEVYLRMNQTSIAEILQKCTSNTLIPADHEVPGTKTIIPDFLNQLR